jgi:hypothetical protein
MDVVVLVKAAPVLTSGLEETMCVAGARVDGPHPEWIRLHPVPFRDLDSEQRFAKYQRVSLNVRRPKTDRRPESWTPVQGSLHLQEKISTNNAWSLRRHLVSQLGESTMCELIEVNRTGSGPGIRSLAVVRPVGKPQFKIKMREEDQLREWKRRAEGVASRQSLFDDSDQRKPDFEVVPWRFSYSFHCSAATCNGHTQTIVDWEVLALWRKVRRMDDWKERMTAKFEDGLWSGRDTVLFVGNQEQYPASFLVCLGFFGRRMCRRKE